MIESTKRTIIFERIFIVKKNTQRMSTDSGSVKICNNCKETISKYIYLGFHSNVWEHDIISECIISEDDWNDMTKYNKLNFLPLESDI